MGSKTQYYTASSLDGFIADPNHSLHWLFQFADVEETSYPEFIRDVGALAMGATTYEWLLRHEIHPEGAEPKPWPYVQPAWVFTHRSLPGLPGADIRFVSGDPGPVHREMVVAAGGKNVWVVGGGELAGQFYDNGLLDELIVQYVPVFLDGGAPLFPRTIATPPLKVLGVSSFAGAFTEIRLELPRSG